MTNCQHLLGISGKAGHGKDTVALIVQLLTWQQNNTAFLLEKQKSTGLDYLGLYPVSDQELAEALVHPDVPMLLLSPNNPWRVKRFAHGVKVIASLLTGIPVEKFEDNAFKQSVLGPEWDREETGGIAYNSELVGMYGSLAAAREAGWAGNAESEISQLFRYKPMQVREMLQLIGTDAMRDRLHTNVWVNMLFADWRLETSANSNPPGTAGVGLDVLTEWPAQHWLITDVRFPNEKQAIEQRGGLVIRVVRPGTNSSSTHPSETALDRTEFEEVLLNDGDLVQLIGRVREMLVRHKVLQP